MPNILQNCMEDMSISYLQALCAKVGYNMDFPKRDNCGVDTTLTCPGKPLETSQIYSPKIEIQLKASYSNVTVTPEGDIKYKLEVKNYNILIREDSFYPKILVLLHMNKDQDFWIEQTRDYLKLTKCAYWLNLKGFPETDNRNTITITIPKENILTAKTLETLMIKASNRENL